MHSAVALNSPAWQPFVNMRPRLFLLAFVYLVFIIYGSLIPFRFCPMPLEVAWASFQQIRYLDLGVVSRADWVANIILYIPISFLWSAALTAGQRSPTVNLLLYFVVFLGCTTVAIGVEFTQLFFHRTTSLNDLIAEFLGTIIGLLLWSNGRGFLLRLWGSLSFGGQTALWACLVFYCLIYLGLSLLPYDFLVSSAELSAKFAKSDYGLIFAGNTCSDLSRCTVKLLADVVITIPIGFLFAITFVTEGRSKATWALIAGLCLGVCIEVLQLFQASGISQGISVVTRAIGVALGSVLYEQLCLGRLAWIRPNVRALILIAVVPYFLVVALVSGWFSAPWHEWNQALVQLEEVTLIPFYHHYFTSEPVAMRSALEHFGVYLPIGLATWAWHAVGANRRRSMGPGMAIMYAVLISLVIELGKLFVPGKHPDLTDVLIAVGAAGAGFLVPGWLAKIILTPSSATSPAPAKAYRPGTGQDARIDQRTPPRAVVESPQTGLTVWRLLSVGVMIGVVAGVLRYPMGSVWLVAVMALIVLYGMMMWRYPWVWLIIVPTALPLLDLAPWTGRFFFDEFDLLLLVTVVVGYWKMPQEATKRILRPAPLCLIALITTSYLISAVIGLLPLGSLDANAFASYYSHYNSLRIAKGFLWAVLLLPLIKWSIREEERAVRCFTNGAMLGLVGVGFAVIWERYVFGGLLNFSDAFRITAMFSAMHTGGGAIETYIAVTIPFVIAWMVLNRSIQGFGLATLVLVVACYALLVTFARAGYLAFICSLLAILIGILIASRKKEASAGLLRALIPVFLAIAVIAVGTPLLRNSFVETRLAASKDDLVTRMDHWQESLGIMDSSVITSLFGMGLGRFPETHFWHAVSGRAPGTYSVGTEGANKYLQLGAGQPLYLGQKVSLQPNRDYTLYVDLRSSSADAVLSVSVCEKTLLYSYGCKGLKFAVPPTSNREWQLNYRVFNSKDLGGPWYARRPVVLDLYNSGRDTLIEVDNVRLQDPMGSEIIRNGDFADGVDYWFFKTDDHLAWHIKNLWGAIYFEQGWLGLLGIIFLVLYTFSALLRLAFRGDQFAPFLLASMVAFLAVGLFDSVFDSPRLATYFYLIVFFTLVSERRVYSRKRGQRNTGRSRTISYLV